MCSSSQFICSPIAKFKVPESHILSHRELKTFFNDKKAFSRIESNSLVSYSQKLKETGFGR
ncbi:hypothetical protein SBDP1_580009 [Syntrophobacter sp. SbD1]|nr:hypothetical protein SBDP1_580009 [Syntrophobacter sp. SbD1]